MKSCISNNWPWSAAAPIGAQGGRNRPGRLANNIYETKRRFNIHGIESAFGCIQQNKDRYVYHIAVIYSTHQPCALSPIIHHCRSLHVSSYLQPGGEREWKVDRENISALSAIFFHKWLRATVEKHAGSAVHSQAQGRGQTQPWTEMSLSAAPQTPPWPQTFDQTSLLSTIKSAVNHPHKQRRGGCAGRRALRRLCTTLRKLKYNHVSPPPKRPREA